MVAVGLYVALQAKPGKEDVASFLSAAVPLVQREEQTTAWFAMRSRPSGFAISGALGDEAGRDAHLAGQVAAALTAHEPELLAEPPTIQKVEIVVGKLACIEPAHGAARQ
jgi:quinol monooxygenase YgiN